MNFVLEKTNVRVIFEEQQVARQWQFLDDFPDLEPSIHNVSPMNILWIECQPVFDSDSSPEPSKENEQIANSDALVDKVSCGSTCLPESWSPARWTRH
jgi:hypothetical protein